MILIEDGPLSAVRLPTPGDDLNRKEIEELNRLNRPVSVPDTIEKQLNLTVEPYERI